MFAFGDTFNHDRKRDFLGVTSSTASIFLDRQLPNISFYEEFDKKNAVKSFIPLMADEAEWDRLGFAEAGQRATLWCFGGVLLVNQCLGSKNISEGWVYFQKGTHYKESDKNVFQYTGLAKLMYEEEDETIVVTRIPKGPMFGQKEPMFGTFTTLRVGNEAFLYGHASPSDKRVMLAKVDITGNDEIMDRTRYLYWDGIKYQPDITLTKPIMDGMQHGAIFRSELFEPGTDRDYVFVGCSINGDNKVIMGTSARPEGPFEVTELMYTYALHFVPVGQYNYCVYPHQWAFDEKQGELMITWSEGGTDGQVVAVKVKLEQNPGPEPVSNTVNTQRKRESSSYCEVS